MEILEILWLSSLNATANQIPELLKHLKFSRIFLKTIFPEDLSIDSLQYIPFGDGQTFEMKADQIEKNKVI